MAGTESIGLSGILTSQRLLDLAGHNISNANTQGYHRQVASLAMRSNSLEVGLGVEITQIRRVLDQSLENAITRNTFSAANLTTQLDALRQVEQQFKPGEGSLLDLWEQLRNQVVTLVGAPDDPANQRVLLNKAGAVVEKINSLHGELTSLRNDMNARLDDSLNQVNAIAAHIASLNEVISRNVLLNQDVNNPSDQRDQLVNQLAKYIDIRVVQQDYGKVNIFAGSVPLVLGDRSIALSMKIDGNDNAQVLAEDFPSPLAVTGGEVGGLLTLRNESIRDVIERMESWSASLVKTMDTVQATGLGPHGPFDILFGQRPVANVNLPLSIAGLAFPPQAGNLFVSVTDQATGARTLHQIAVNPASQNLNDIANALSAIPNMQAVVDTQTHTLTIFAQAGFAFDFAGRLPTAPENVAISGTAPTSIGGQYTGKANDEFTYTVVGSGTVGVTPNLGMEARNSAGQLIGAWNIGQGYEPGSELPAIQGVKARIGGGTLNNGDSFSTRVIAQPDTAGILTALGVNTFFQGDTPGSLQVRPDLVMRSELLAGSRSGLLADGSNWQRLVAGLDANTLSGGASNMRKYLTDLTTDVGSKVLDLDQRQTALVSLGAGLEAERQSISGVDPNEELVKLLQYQRSFQLSSRFLRVVNDTLQELLRLV